MLYVTSKICIAAILIINQNKKMFDVQFVDVDVVQSSCCCFTVYKTITSIKLQTILTLITTSDVMILQVYTVPIYNI